MIYRHYRDHITGLENTGYKLTKLDLLILDSYFTRPELTVKDVFAKYGKKRNKPLAYFKTILKGLSQNSLVNQVVHLTIEQAMSPQGLLSHELTATINTVFGSIFCERTGRTVSAATFADRKEIIRRLTRRATALAGSSAIVPSGARMPTLEAIRDSALTISARYDEEIAKVLRADLHQRGIKLTSEEFDFHIARIAQMSSHLPQSQRLSHESVRRQFDSVIAVRDLRAANAEKTN